MNVVITGNTKGFGLALTKEFLKAGDNVVISSRNKERVDQVVDSLRKQFPSADILGLPCDVADYKNIMDLANLASQEWGIIDIWVNNAGTAGITRNPLVDVSEEEFQMVINTNLLGTFYGCKAALTVMMPQNNGHIFNVSGWGADGRASPNSAAYGATKASIPQFTKSLVKETYETNIGTHMLLPGMMMTDLLLKNATSDARRIFNILSDYPEIVAKEFVPKMRQITGTGKVLRYLKRRNVMWRFLTASRRKYRFFDSDGNFIPYSES